ncbi:LysR family transcriptional regulator [Paenibacillus sp. ACRRX]|uniref:LysR family transcriptional regulator n=1 Tax=Paenibacillus sp. ACRRX TaxID=2918206 RepID=UPI001EF66A1D|nr:LysR family transcriptional regulator [Paenibacillus sp. ACRRX]MCG7406851.1 LysR family transcriptional regulator [Paenibacillus sp. ACRRX]
MTLARFEIFTKVVELGSFTKAAETLNLTQSAVSHAVAGLEAEWGVTLLLRDRRRGLLLTEVGQKTLVHMQDIVNSVYKMKQELALVSNLEAGSIRVGSFTSASSSLLPRLISAFHRKYPNIEFVFYEGTYEEIEEWLDTGVVDIGFVLQPNENTKFHTIPLVRDRMVVAFGADHRFHQVSVVDVQQLESEPMIMPKGVYRTHVNDIFLEAGYKPCIRFEVMDCNTIANMVQEGLGITIGPELFLTSQSGITTRHLTQLKWRSIELACPSLQSASPAVRAFLAIAEDIYQPAQVEDKTV